RHDHARQLTERLSHHAVGPRTGLQHPVQRVGPAGRGGAARDRRDREHGRGARRQPMSRNRRWLLVVGVVALAFNAGFGWQYVRAERLERELGAVRQELALVRAETVIAAAAVSA